jgi:hypothetical protein
MTNEEWTNKIDKGNKILTVIVICWAILLIPFVFLIDKKNVPIFIVAWMLWIIIGVILSPKLIYKY